MERNKLDRQHTIQLSQINNKKDMIIDLTFHLDEFHITSVGKFVSLPSFGRYIFLLHKEMHVETHRGNASRASTSWLHLRNWNTSHWRKRCVPSRIDDTTMSCHPKRDSLLTLSGGLEATYLHGNLLLQVHAPTTAFTLQELSRNVGGTRADSICRRGSHGGWHP